MIDYLLTFLILDFVPYFQSFILVTILINDRFLSFIFHMSESLSLNFSRFDFWFLNYFFRVIISKVYEYLSFFLYCENFFDHTHHESNCHYKLYLHSISKYLYFFLRYPVSRDINHFHSQCSYDLLLVSIHFIKHVSLNFGFY